MSTHPIRHSIPADILALSQERDALRKRGRYEQADALKKQIEDAGYGIKDNPRGAHLIILPSIEIDDRLYRTARQVPSLLDAPDTCVFSVIVLASNSFEQTRRCLTSALRFAGDTAIEVLLVDNASFDELPAWTEEMQRMDSRLHVLRASRPMGHAEAYNVGLKQSRGRYILLLDTSIELIGDIFTPLAHSLETRDTGITGMQGLDTEDLRHFEASERVETEAIEGTCMAFRRALLKKAGLFDERYRYPAYMDIDFNFAVRDQGTRAVVTPDLPVLSHPAAPASALSDAEQARLGKRNFYRFLEKWGHREDLLVE